MKLPRKKVLFVCIGNSCRSPMAEAIARSHAREEMEVASAGLAPLGFVADLTMQTLQRNGYSVEDLTSKPISPQVWESADIVINMSGRPKEFAFRNLHGHAKIEDWEIEDPYGDPQKYQGTYEAVRRRVIELVERLRNKSGSGESRAGAANQLPDKGI